MKTFLNSIGLITLLFISFQSFAQRAKDGNYTATASGTVVNTYTYLTAPASAGATSITVNSNNMSGAVFSGALAPGDLILIIQMYGASVDINTTPTTSWGSNYTVPNDYFSCCWFVHHEFFGQVTGYGSAGKFERAEVLSVSGSNTINLQCALENSYDNTKRVQIVRIPRFDNLTVNNGASITPPLWDGFTGGVVALEVETSLTVNSGGSIDASASGFRGGFVDGTGNGGTGDCCNLRFLGTSTAAEGSEKGESIFGYHTELDAVFSRYGMGAVANGGGGAGYQNCGGGGGSNVEIGFGYYTGRGMPPAGYAAAWALDTFMTTYGPSSPGGGRGGYSLSDNHSLNPTFSGPANTIWGQDNRKWNGGFGGHPLIYDASRLFFGGGGGAGDQDSGQGGSGGRGGGIVYLVNYGTTTGAGSIDVNGEAGQNSNPNNQPVSIFSQRKGNDGAGGGGAGGSIYIENSGAIPGTLGLNAIGGDGGDQVLSLYSGQPWEASGPGGSGSGGLISYTNGTPAETVTGGVGGVTNSTDVNEFPPNGATNGNSGVASQVTPFYDLIVSDTTLCGSSSVDLTVVVSGTLPGGSTVEWYTQEFGGASINSGLTYTTPVLGASTTYWVGVCPGSFRQPINVIITPGPNLVVTDPVAVCEPSTVDLTAPAVTAGSDPGTLTYWNDAGATSPIATPAAVTTTGVYYIQLDAGGGCAVVQPVNVTVDPQEDASFTMTPNCTGGTATVTGTPGGTFSFNTPPIDAAVIDPNTGAITNGTTGNTYDVLYTTSGTCFATSTQMVTAASDLAYTAVLTDENCGGGDGEISLSATGGDGGPYQYSITGGAPYSGSGLFTGLSAGTFNISVLDNSGCEVTGTEIINTTGAPVIDSIVGTDPTCNGSCDGTITVYVSGGTPPYSYQWYDVGMNPIGTDSPNISGICAGDYSVEVTDASGAVVYLFQEPFSNSCASDCFANTYVGPYGAWTITASGPNGSDANDWYISGAECGNAAGVCGTSCGATDPSLHISSPVVGDAGAVYMAGGLGFWFIETDKRAESPVINCTGQTGMTISFNYIENGDGVIDNAELWYNDGGGWTFWQDLPKSTLCGGQGLWTNVTMPMPAWADNNPNVQVGFRWYNNDDNVGTDPSFAVDDIEISLASTACPAVANFTLTDPPVLSITNVATVDPTCNGGSDGSIAITATGGTPVLQYSIDNGTTFQAGNSFGSLGAATYDVVVEDANGCQASTTATLTDPAAVSITNVATTDPLCNGTSDGTITITASGGTGSLQYSIDNGTTFQAGNSFSSLGATTYDVVVEDANGCQASTTATLTDPTAISITNVATSDPSCNGGADGTITITASGGTGALQYSVDNGTTFQAGNTFSSLGSATYDIVVEDANGCQASTTATLTDPAAISITNVATTDPLCNGTSDGTITITASGGTGSLQYSVDNGTTFQAGNSFGSLGASTYNIVVEDANGCQASTTATLTDPTAVSITNVATTDPLCNGTSDGTITITASGGTGSLQYSVDNGTTFQAGNSFGSLGASTYNIVVEDANGCQASTTATLTDPTVVSITNVATVDPTCGNADGSITITASGGTGSLQYSVDNGTTFQAGNTFSSLGATTYNIVVEDVNGCQASTTATLTDQGGPTITNVSTTDPLCNGSTDGSIDITASGGTGSLQYSIDNGTTFQSGNTFGSLGATTYNIVIEDGNGCQASTTATLTDPTAISITNVATVDPSCNGGSDGTITITASGGTGSLQYSVDNGTTFQSGNSFGSLGATTYNIVVEDANGCQLSTTATLTDPTAISITNVATTDPLCNGGSDGTITITASGGTGSLQYSVDNGTTFQAGNGFGSLAANTYYIVVEDANGCQASTTATLTDPTGITITNVATVDPTCGNADGSIDITAVGGSGSLQYSIDNGTTFQAGNTFSAIGAATYTIVVEDANGCQVSTTATLTDQGGPTITNVATTDPLCNGGTDGSIDITASGGTGSLQYSIDNGTSFQAGNTFGSLGATTYNIVVEDGNGCQASTTATLTDPPVISIANVSTTDPLCNGSTDGSIDITASGGTGSLQYSIDNGTTFQAGNTFGSLAAATYDIVVEDANGCQASTTATLTDPTPVSITNVATVDPTCGNTDGSIDITASGGTGALQYSIDNGTTFQAGSTFGTLGAATYDIVVEDANGCQATTQVPLSNAGGPVIDSIDVTDPGCNGMMDGSIIISASGGTGALQYSIDNGTTFQAGNSFGSIGAATYDIVVEDAGGCLVTSQVTLTEPTALTVTETITDQDCGQSNGSISLVVSGGTTSYSYLWSPGNETTSSISSLTAGSYGVTVTDANGCTITGNYTVNTIGSLPVVATPSSATINAGESVQLNATGATSYSWTPSGGLSCSDCPDPIATPTETTSYIVTGTDTSGCFGYDTVTIVVNNECADIYVPNMIAPGSATNTDNEFLCVFGECISTLTFRIYDRWGELIFETQTAYTQGTTSMGEVCWDGTYKGKLVQSGIYVYTLNAVLNNGDTKEQSGNITVVR